jgi:hypothetical protein
MAEMYGMCTTCGFVVLDAQDVELRIGGPGADAGGEIVFRCPICLRRFRTEVDAQTARGLQRAGVRGTQPTATAEKREGHPENPPPGPPLTFDDLLDFHELLESDSWLERCANA